METSFHNSLQSPIQPADEAYGLASPQVDNQHGTKGTSESDPPTDDIMIDSVDANPSACDLGGRGG